MPRVCSGRIQKGIAVLWKTAENYLQAAATVSDIVARVNPDTWDGAGLGSWDLRSLVSLAVSFV